MPPSSEPQNPAPLSIASRPSPNTPSTATRVIRIFLLILIIIGVGLIATQNLWVPKLVNIIAPTPAVDLNSTPLGAATTSAPSVPDTSNWQTYGNDRYGFEFQYPAKYQLLVSPPPEEGVRPYNAIVSVTDPSPHGMLIPGFSIDLIGDVTGGMFTYGCNSKSGEPCQSPSLADLSRKQSPNQEIIDNYDFNGIAAVKAEPFRPSGGAGIGTQGPASIYFQHNSLIYEITFNEEYLSISQIAKTFKFTK